MSQQIPHSDAPSSSVNDQHSPAEERKPFVPPRIEYEADLVNDTAGQYMHFSAA